MSKLAYYCIYALIYVISIMPFWMIYGLSNFNYIIIYRIIGYRKKVVRKNIRNSFPEKSESELKTIERKFYHWFCDYFLETFKLLTISDKNLLKHFELRGIEQLEKNFDLKQDCAAILGHYCNWEWLSAVLIGFKRHRDAVMGLIYHGIRNAPVNKMFNKIRSAHGGVCINKRYVPRFLLKYKNEDRRYLFGYISDQTPKYYNIHLWIEFLNQETPVFTGGEKLMRKMNNAVYFVEMQRPKRGKYICTFRLITDKPNEMPEFEITKVFFQMLEESIRKNPEFYLWTHNRWKRTRDEYNKRMDEKHKP